MTKITLGLLFAVYLLGCTTVSIQTREVLNNPPREIPKEKSIESLVFVSQENDKDCGPTTLAMAMNHAGVTTDLTTLKSEIINNKNKGTLPTDMILAARQRGLMAIPLSGYISLLKEVAADHPVIVLQNLSFRWAPSWHYAIVKGYDLDKQEIIMNSGKNESERMPMTYFERHWQLADYWGLVILAPHQLSASADELTHVQAAVGLEKIEKLAEAKVAYKTILERWPRSLAALIGLGNISYKKKNITESVRYLQLAVKFHPDSTVARHNLSVARAAQK